MSQTAPVLTEKRRTSPARLLGLAVVPFLVFLVVGIYSIAQRQSQRRVLAQQTEAMATPHVAVTHAVSVSGNTELMLPGTLNAYVESPIYARTSGYVSKWYKDIGSRVNKGDLLAELDAPEVDQQLAQARADLAAAQANVELARITADRYEALLDSNSVSHQEVDNAKGTYAARKASLDSAQANVKRLEELEAFKRVYAPFAGVITQRNVDIGNLINAGNGGASKEMFDLAQTDPLRVYVSVPESYASSIHTAMKACVDTVGMAGRQVCGQVVRTANSIDASTRTLLTEVDVPNSSGALLPGAFAQVHFGAKLVGERLRLGVNALLFRPEGTMAAVVGPDNRVDLKKISIGRDFGTTVEVLQGLSISDAVVVNPADSLEQGQEVRVVEPQAEAPRSKSEPQPAKR